MDIYDRDLYSMKKKKHQREGSMIPWQTEIPKGEFRSRFFFIVIDCIGIDRSRTAYRGQPSKSAQVWMAIEEILNRKHGDIVRYGGLQQQSGWRVGATR